MSERIVIDPITRIEGHLRVEAEIEGGTIKNAYSSGTMVRGIENIVKDRDPRDVWAFVGRVCGVCTSIHSLASVRAVENARGIVIPPNASMVRNIMQAVLYMHDHTVHFYQLHALDWVDVVSALKADPKAAALLAQQLSPWAKNTEGYFTATQERLKKFVASGQLGIFANGYWGHPDYAGTEPYRYRPLSGRIGMAERGRQGTRCVRGQESASKLYRRRYALQHRLK